jgi:putative transposase
VSFITEHQEQWGVEPICRELQVAPSNYYAALTRPPSARRRRDEALEVAIRRVWGEHRQVYGADKVWAQLKREGIPVARCTVERLMRDHGICGAKRRGKPWRTTKPDPAARRRPDLVDRDFTATGPNRLWVADITYLRCWEGVVFFAFVLDAWSRRVVGWQLAGHMRTTLVLDALRMALHQRGGGADAGLIHHSDAGSQPGLNRSSQQLCLR